MKVCCREIENNALRIWHPKGSPRGDCAIALGMGAQEPLPVFTAVCGSKR